MSQRRRRRGDGSEPEDEDNGADQAAVHACVRFLICREGNKVPIKRTEIVKHLGGACALPSARVGAVLAAANRLLKTVYGYKLVQVEGKGGTQYIVVLCTPAAPAAPASPVTCAAQHTLLVTALTHIFMSGGSVKEEDMWKFLQKANLLDENDHTGRKILTSNFTKQMYLTYVKEGEGDFSRFVFRWGQRASEETSTMFILQKMAQAFDKPPEHWSEQNRLATAEEREGAEAV